MKDVSPCHTCSVPDITVSSGASRHVKWKPELPFFAFKPSTKPTLSEGPGRIPTPAMIDVVNMVPYRRLLTDSVYLMGFYHRVTGPWKCQWLSSTKASGESGGDILKMSLWRLKEKEGKGCADDIKNEVFQNRWSTNIKDLKASLPSGRHNSVFTSYIFLGPLSQGSWPVKWQCMGLPAFHGLLEPVWWCPGFGEFIPIIPLGGGHHRGPINRQNLWSMGQMVRHVTVTSAIKNAKSLKVTSRWLHSLFAKVI